MKSNERWTFEKSIVPSQVKWVIPRQSELWKALENNEPAKKELIDLLNKTAESNK